jgi:hypothetical protein
MTIAALVIMLPAVILFVLGAAPQSPVDDLTMRLRRPLGWALAHPLRVRTARLEGTVSDER